MIDIIEIPFLCQRRDHVNKQMGLCKYTMLHGAKK